MTKKEKRAEIEELIVLDMTYTVEWGFLNNWTVISGSLVAAGVIGPKQNNRKWYKTREAALSEAMEIAKIAEEHNRTISLIVVQGRDIVEVEQGREVKGSSIPT